LFCNERLGEVGEGFLLSRYRSAAISTRHSTFAVKKWLRKRFIARREDELLLGPPDTGKSRLAQAIGRAAIQQGYRVIYREAHTLLEELADAARRHTQGLPDRAHNHAAPDHR
jgi:DNA replication protein DnaC